MVSAAAAAGFPEISPEPVIESPEGSVGETLKTNGAEPPVAVTGVKAVIAAPAVTSRVAMTWVATSAELTLRLKTFEVVAPAPSVMVTV